jgi:hypothetical protein
MNGETEVVLAILNFRYPTRKQVAHRKMWEQECRGRTLERVASDLSCPLLVCVRALQLSVELDLDIRGRNCDRPVERSPALEGLDELGALLRRHPLEMKVQPHRVEQA